MTEIYRVVDRCKAQTFGYARDGLDWALDVGQATRLLTFFCETCLPFFGRFQDAMTDQSHNAWSLYHSRLSFALNVKLLSPKQVIDSAIEAYRASPSTISLPQVEGFVRQILGWREYVRGVYWANMPNYANLNFLNAKASLPKSFWSGDTDMNCVRAAVTQSLERSYAHHIQRLMITGNYAMLGVDPTDVDEWYLGIYADAIEWVEMPNTRGMSQFADGGIVGTKPYAASGAYVNRMSDYCRSCRYKVKQSTGPDACPLNSLYWHFLDRNRTLLSSNPRMSLPYRNWDKKSSEDRIKLLIKPNDRSPRKINL